MVMDKERYAKFQEWFQGLYPDERSFYEDGFMQMFSVSYGICMIVWAIFWTFYW